MSNTVYWIVALMDEKDEIKALKKELEAKEDRITALETRIAQMQLVMRVMAQQIPQSVTFSQTVRYL